MCQCTSQCLHIYIYIYMLEETEQMYYHIRFRDVSALHIEAETKLTPFRRRHFQMDFLEWKCMNFDLFTISLKFDPRGPVNNIPSLVQIMAWRRPGDKPLSEPMTVSSLTHICVTRLQWVKAACFTVVRGCLLCSLVFSVLVRIDTFMVSTELTYEINSA